MILLKALNQNSKQNFIVSIGAKIGDSFALFSSLNLVVEVQSSNLNGPYFIDSSYLITIDSNSQLVMF